MLVNPQYAPTYYYISSMYCGFNDTWTVLCGNEPTIHNYLHFFCIKRHICARFYILIPMINRFSLNVIALMFRDYNLARGAKYCDEYVCLSVCLLA